MAYDTQDAETKPVDPNNSTSLTLEKFMVKLCTHHQKQFIHVLNNLCTDEPLVKSKSPSVSVSDLENTEENDHPCSVRKLNLSLTELNSSASETCLNSPRKLAAIKAATVCVDMASCHSQVAQNSDELLELTVSSDFKEQSVRNCTLHNCIHSTDQPEQTIAKNHILCVKTTEDKLQTLAIDEAECVKNSELNQSVFVECSVFSQNNSALSLLNDAQESELPVNVPKIADKENTQYISPKQTLLDKDDCKLKQENSLHTIVVKTLGNHLNHCDNTFENFQNLNDNSGSALQKVRLHENIKHSKTVKCKNTPCLRKNDYDKQCDVVYLSDPITAECHIENQKSLVCPRNTARKSTRGYLFSGDCCELSTVRTLVRNSKVEDKGNCALHISEALIIPNGMISETLPSTDVLSLVPLEEARVEKDYNSIPENDTVDDIIPDAARFSTSGTHIDQIPDTVKQSVDSVSKSLIAVFSLVHDEPEKTLFSRSHAANELPQNGHSDERQNMAEMNAPVVYTDNNYRSGNDHENRVADFATDSLIDVAHSNISVSQGDNSVLPSLDLDIVVSFNNEPLLSECNMAVELPADESSPLKITVEEASSTLEHSCVGPSIESSSTFFPNTTDDKDLALLASYCPSQLKDSETLLEKFSVAMITDPEVTHVQESLDEIIPKENSEDPSSKTLQAYINCASPVTNLQEENSEKMIVNENVSIISPKILDDLKEEQTLASNPDKCSVEIEPKDDTELKALETLHPSQKELDCSTPANSVDRNCTEDVDNLLDTCAKTGGNTDVKAKVKAISKRGTQQCDIFTSLGGKENDKVEESLETKEEIITDLAKLDNHIVHGKNTNDELLTRSKKKLQKAPAPSDRRLRSRKGHTDLCSQKDTSLQIEISYLPSTSTTQRSVELKTENNTKYSLLTSMDSTADESPNGENYFGQFLNNQFAEEKQLLSDRMFKSKCSSTCKMSENIRICYEIGSNKRKPYFAVESNKDGLSVEDKESNNDATISENTCQFELKKCNKRISANTSNSLSCARSSTKHVALNALKHNLKFCKTKILKHLSAENVTQPIRFKKSAGYKAQQLDISFKNSELIGKEKDRPRFLDWCSEEENQERISNFNNKYMYIHKNWIPHKKESATVTKSKNKADKLKEIWKTKKRVRKNKSLQEAPRYSPMQMLFMNSLKVSDICRWFLETTETKSLVIVKKINTRLPEEHQLPIIPMQRHSRQSLYPHTIQAERLKKRLKKFASIFPARNNLKTQNALAKLIEDNNIPLGEVPEGTEKRVGNCKKLEPQVHTNKPTSARILRKYYNFRENLRQSALATKNKRGSMLNESESKTNNIEHIKRLSTLQTFANSPAPKYAITDEKPKGKKRPKDDSLTKPVAQPSKKRKIETKQEFVKNRHCVNKNALATKNEVHKVKKIDLVSKSEAPKKPESKTQVCKAASLKKRNAKIAMQKHSGKTQLVIRKCQTRSTKPRPITPNLLRQRITTTSSSQPGKKEIHRKIYTASAKGKKRNATSRVKNHKPRSQPDSPTHSKRRSLELK